MLKSIPSLISVIKDNIVTITARAAFNEIVSNNGVIIDVREPEEVKQGVMKGVPNIPRGVLEMKMLQLYPNAEQLIYIHCASGIRAIFAAEQLQRVGYKNIKAITCNIKDIQAAALEIN